LLRLNPPYEAQVRLDGQCVQGAGTYSPPDDDRRLLGIPCSRGRVAALDPN